MEKKIIVSSCLLNNPVRYDGKKMNFKHPFLDKLNKEGRLIPYCPEVEGGMSIPRVPCELQLLASDVYKEKCGIVNKNGDDVTRFFISGVTKIDHILTANEIVGAILKENSPSCGVNFVYDGTFSGKLKPGKGLFAHYLNLNKIKVYCEKEIDIMNSEMKID